MPSIRLSIIILFAVITSCASADTRESTIENTREEKILKLTEDKEKADKYEIYLVAPESYTTIGADFHEKYHKYLIGVARSVYEEKKITIVEKSIGFYYDKREDKKNKLYLGIDIIATVESSAMPYRDFALAQLEKYLKDILYVLQSCAGIFKENEVVGSVIGIKWERDSLRESVTIWIDKKDVLRYENKELTFNEIIHRNFVTNTEGKIIKLLK